MQFNLPFVKDLGLKREVMDALPYAVVGGTWQGSFSRGMYNDQYYTSLNHVVPAGHQLKILFLRVWTQELTGARFSIVQVNPAALGATGLVEAYPVVGNTPPFAAGATAVRDYPMLEAPGAEVLHGSLRDPIHVLEGSITFNILAQYPGAAAQAQAGPATGAIYGYVWWGVQDIPENHP